MKRAIQILAAAALLLCGVGHAQADVMTFLGVPTSSTAISYTEAGMTVTGNPNIWSWPSAGELHLDPSGFGSNVETFTFGGAPFDVQSVDLSYAVGGTAVFQGFDASNNLVASLTESAGSIHTVSFSGFNNITKFVVSDPSVHFSIDNLTFSASAVPEPTSLALFGLTTAAAGCYGWRRRKQTVVV